MSLANVTTIDERRDRELRKKLLMVLHIVRGYSPDGSASAGYLLNEALKVCRPLRFDSDAHALGLMRDLVHLGYATESANGERRPGEAFGLDWARFTVTAAGSQRYTTGSPLHPLMDDVDALKGGF